MANLSVENLSRAVQTGNIEKMFESKIQRDITPAAGDSPDQLGSATAHPRNFSEILKDSVEKVNEYQHEADTAIKELVAGRNKNIHETMLTVERADASLKMMMQVRNKILEAYREVMRMQV